MGKRALDFDWVTPTLAVGAGFASADAARLAREHGIRHVVDVRVEECDDERVLRRHGIELLHLPTEDVCAIDDERIDDGVAWVNERLDRGERVLVHCQHGVGRSALLALCVLVSRGDEPLEALLRAKKRGASSRRAPTSSSRSRILRSASRADFRFMGGPRVRGDGRDRLPGSHGSHEPLIAPGAETARIRSRETPRRTEAAPSRHPRK